MSLRAFGAAFGSFIGAVVVVLVVWTFAPMLWGWKPFVVQSDSMAPAARRGDVILIDPAARYRRGDVLTYRRPGADPVTHRLVGGDATTGYLTKGDANQSTDPQPVRPDDVLGRVRVLVPLLGWPGLTLRAVPVAVLFLAGVGWVTVIVVRHRRRAGVRACVAVLAAVTTLSGSVVAPTYAAFAGTTSTAMTAATRSRFYPQAVIAAGPVSYWRLGETGAATRADQMGVAALTCTGAGGGVYAGAVAKDTNAATRLPVAAARCQAAGTPLLSMTTAFTVIAWERSITWPQTPNGRIVAKYGGSTGTLNYMLAWDGAGTSVRALVDTTNGRSTAVKAMANNANWHMIAMVWDGTLRLYVDGVQQTAVAAPGTPVATSSPMFLGYNASDSMVGELDEVAVFARALPAAEIADLYALA